MLPLLYLVLTTTEEPAAAITGLFVQEDMIESVVISRDVIAPPFAVHSGRERKSGQT